MTSETKILHSHLHLRLNDIGEQVQQQPNLTDCGLYLCQNTETFFKNPIKDFTLPITSIRFDISLQKLERSYSGLDQPMLFLYSKRWFPESEVRAKRENVAKLVSVDSEQVLETSEKPLFAASVSF